MPTRMKKPKLTLERLHEVLEYNPETGDFTWLISTGPRCVVGDKAGFAATHGYIRLSLDGSVYMAHRLAWFYMTGRWPLDFIDHENGVPNDNRYENLRQATHAQNMRNTRAAKNKNDGLPKGVKKTARKKGPDRYIATIWNGTNNLHLGLFNTPEEASAAYEAKANELYGDYRRS